MKMLKGGSQFGNHEKYSLVTLKAMEIDEHKTQKSFEFVVGLAILKF